MFVRNTVRIVLFNKTRNTVMLGDLSMPLLPIDSAKDVACRLPKIELTVAIVLKNAKKKF